MVLLHCYCALTVLLSMTQHIWKTPVLMTFDGFKIWTKSNITMFF